MYCKNCGTQLEDSAKFCISCGTPQTDAANINTSISQEDILLEVELKEKNLWIAAGANLLFPGIGYFYAGSIGWGIIIIIAFIGAIYVGDAAPISGLYLLSILGSVYQAYRFNKKVLEETLNSSRKQPQNYNKNKVEKGLFD